MKIGVDYWQVISHYPGEFAFMVSAWISEGAEVHVISAVGKNRQGTVKQAVDGLGFDLPVHELVFDHPKQSPELKLAKCLELGIQIFYDDRDDVCRLLNKNEILACRVTRRDNSTYDLEAEIK